MIRFVVAGKRGCRGVVLIGELRVAASGGQIRTRDEEERGSRIKQLSASVRGLRVRVVRDCHQAIDGGELLTLRPPKVSAPRACSRRRQQPGCR